MDASVTSLPRNEIQRSQPPACFVVAQEIAEVQRRITALKAIGEDGFADALSDEELSDLKEKQHAAHAWRWVRDWEGDSNVYRGTNDLSCWRCVHCDEVGSSWRNDPAYSYSD